MILTDNPFREAVKQWGVDSQMAMVAEEVGEMLSALSKFKRGRIKPMELASEIADVRIMLDQVAHVVEEMTAGSVTAYNFEVWCDEMRKVKTERLCGMLGIKFEAGDMVQGQVVL